MQLHIVYVCYILQRRDKVIVSEAEGSVEMGKIQSVLSKSSSGSSFKNPLTEQQDGPTATPSSQLQRQNARLTARVKELEEEVERVKEAGSKRDEGYQEQATESVQQASDAEQRERKLKSENTKLRTKLQEAEEVATQVESLAEQVHVLCMQ